MPRRISRLCCVLLCATLPAITQAASFTLGSTEFKEFKLAQANGPELDYYLSKTARPAPLILFIQGSGCAPVFHGFDSGKRYSNIFNYIPWGLEGKYAVMVVNKPYAAATPPAKLEGALSCSRQFNDYFSLDNWVRDLRAALAHARQQPWVDQRRMLVLGSSEGATVAAALAAADAGVTDVALVGASGPSQLYDFVVAAYKAPGTDAEVAARLAELDATRKQIFARPDSVTDFAWGHTFKRWSSFFRASSTANLQKSRARIYLASGMQDMAVPILSTESMAAELQAAGRDITVRRVPNGGHGLVPDGAPPDDEYARILSWYEQVK
jgi:pimeloyl-ACP methyl ester carboxylesterase